MPPPPLTTREYAYIYITGPGTHEEVTERLGMQPSEAFNPGDPSPYSGRPIHVMRWCLQSGLNDTHPLNEHIQSLLLALQIKGRAQKLRELWVDYDLILMCVGHFPPSCHGIHFDREQVRQLAKLGLAIDCDFYYLDDHEQEI